MTTFFDGLAKNFKDVQTNPGINTKEFNEATTSLLTLFDLIGSTAFAPVKSDMAGNVNKISKKYQENPQKCETLQSMIQLEEGEKKNTATEGLMWLKRALDFTSQALRRTIDDPQEELSTSFTKAYENTLKKHHNMFVKPIFTMAMKAVPKRADFFNKLGSDQAKVNSQFKEWLSALESIVATLNKIYIDNGMEK